MLNNFSFLQNGPSQLVTTQLPLPHEKHEEPVHTESDQTYNEHSDSDAEFDLLDLPEVPSSSKNLNPDSETVSRPENTLEKSEKNETQEKQFLPFISPPFGSISVTENCPSPRSKIETESKTRTGFKDDLQDVLAAAQAAAENAERAATAAWAAASLAQVRITELVKKQNEYESNPFSRDENEKSNLESQGSLSPPQSLTFKF